MGKWHYIAVRNEEGEYWLHENFPGKGYTENPVSIGGDSVKALAMMLRNAAKDIETFAPIEPTEKPKEPQ
ncbi:MAG: hypothetical protein QM805_07595 [Pseudomonas sp.]